MDYQKLLLAASVRELAARLRNGKADYYWRSLEGCPDRNQRRDEWKADHPVEEFVPEALTCLERIAGMIP